MSLNCIFRVIALSFLKTDETPHLNRIAFNIKGKRIFATLHEKSETVE